MDVTDVLRDRMQEPPGLRLTSLVSLLVHATFAAAMVFGPVRWFSSQSAVEEKPVMTITLGGAGTGPRSGGLTAIGGRPVQTTEPAPKPEAIRAPAAKVPEMTTPKAVAKASAPVKVPAPPVESAPAEARGKTPTRGAEVRAGSAVAETGVRGQGFGLSSGGGGGFGSTLDVADFCCPAYLILMNDRIWNNWSRQVEVAGVVTVKFTIQRDGRVSDTAVEQSSGYAALDLNARRAVEATRQLAPLPPEYPNQTLTVHLHFPYQR